VWTFVLPPPQLEWGYNIWLSERSMLASALSVPDWDRLEAGMRVPERVLESQMRSSRSARWRD
jgi:hypothetical protein